MNSSNATAPENQKIEAYKVSPHARIGTLPRHFGRHMMAVEGLIYDLLRRFSPAYGGGVWEFQELSNGGFFMTPPPGRYRLAIPTNGYQGEMSAEAAGITVCLFCFSLLSFEYRGTDTFTSHFHWLRDYALEHPESGEIFAAID